MTIANYDRNAIAKTITQRGAKWGFVGRENGKKKRFSKDTLDEAIDCRIAYLMAKEGKPKRKAGPLVRTLAGAVHDYHKTLSSPKSVARYEQVAECLFRFFGREKELTKVTLDEVRQYIERRNVEAVKARGREMSKNGLRTELTYLKRLMGRAGVHPNDNPITNKILPKKERRSAYISEADMKRFMRGCTNLKFKYLVQVVHWTGMRRLELVTIRPCDFDFENLTFTIRGENLKGIGENKGDQVRAMVPEAAEIIQEWIEIGDIPERGKLFDYQPDSVTYLFKSWRKKLKLSGDFFCHGHRHTAITNVINDHKLPTSMTMLMSGHADSRSLDVYTEITAKDVGKAFKANKKDEAA